MLSKLSTLTEKNLIMNSSIIDDYPVLKKFYEVTPNLDESKLDTLDDETKNLFTSGFFEVIKNKAPNEWEIDFSKTNKIDSSDENSYCELCNKKIKNLCYIKNKINNKRLRVGSTCVTHFGIIDKKTLDEVIKQRNELKRRAELNKLINNVEKTLNNCDLFIEKSPIVIKNSKLEDFINIKKEAFNLKNKFISSNLESREKKEIVDKLNDRILGLEKGKVLLNRYIELNKNNKFILTKNILSSLDSNDFKGRESLLKDGFVSEKNIFKINDIEFIRSISNDFNKYLRKYNMEIIDTVNRNGIMFYQIDIYRKNLVIVDYKYNDFALNYGSLLFSKEPLENISIESVFKSSRIINNITIKSIIDSIEGILYNTNFEIEDIFYDFNEIVIKNNKNNKYIILDFKYTIENFKYLLISEENQKQNLKKLIDFIKKSKNIKNKSEIYEYKKQRS
ncbi:TPA: hypothetical protein KRG96_003435 [Clostridioides difficile]|nr:hypothetical protein [Clostridioides difficile]HBF2451793.1 hypothetical protein [Clostridioides difficile]HBF2829456.1 hypothetical protein [Clostridioides difficile]HBG8384371.1 hypothetical protein [Clostridioides difficile]HDF3825041.1 hypothetical protein [Clostridioides difficile]